VAGKCFGRRADRRSLRRHDGHGRLERIVLKDRTAPYRDGSRAGWAKLKDRSWYEREAWRFERR
jgi:ATP-dependent DNA ligase